MSKKSFFRRGLSILSLMVFGLSLFSFSVSAQDNDKQILKSGLQEQREESRIDYINMLNEKIKNWEVIFWTDKMMRSNGQVKNFYIKDWNDKQTLFFSNNNLETTLNEVYYKFRLTNNASSEDEANFAVYQRDLDWTIGHKLTKWKTDIDPGDSWDLQFLTSKYNFNGVFVIVENNWWSWNHNIPVFWTVQNIRD